MSEYYIRLDFEAGGEPPRVYICDSTGCAAVEVIEEPLLRGEIYNYYNLSNPWTKSMREWSPGPLAVKILGYLNGQM